MNTQPVPAESDLPENARKVFSGIIFDVYQWEQELFDGSTATFEKLKRAGTVVGLCIDTNGKIIVSEQEQPGKTPFQALLGGRIEPGEDQVQAVKREVLEESGYQGEEPELWFISNPASKISWNIYIYIIRNCKKTAESELDPGEKVTLRFLDFEEFVELAVHNSNFSEVELSLLLSRAALKNGLAEIKEKLYGSAANVLQRS